MPTVPVVTQGEQTLSPLTSQRFQAPDTGEAGRILAAGGQRMGQALQQASAISADTQAIYAEARAKQLDNEYVEYEREVMFGEGGFYTKQNADAVDAMPATQEALERRIGELVNRTKDGVERQMLTDVLQRRRAAALQGVTRYGQEQQKQFAVTTSTARRDNAIDSYVRFLDDPDLAAQYRATAMSEVSALADLQGLNDGEVVQAMRQDTLTALHKGAVMATMQGDPAKAAAYLEQHRDEIDAPTQLGLDNQLYPLLIESDARLVVDEVVRSIAPLTQTIQLPGAGAPQEAGDLSGVWSRMIRQESGGRQMANGRPLTSSAGAIGIAQVMPATARETAQELGIAWDENRYRTDAKYNEMLGQAYFSKMLRRFNGDVEKAVASYNAGPGGVDRAIRRGGAANWREHLPEETKGYLQNIIGDGAERGAVASQASITRPPALETQMEFAESYIRERFAGKEPRYIEDLIQQTRSGLRQRHSDAEMARREQENALFDAAKEVAFNLQDGFTSITQIPGYQNLPIDQRMQLDNMADQNRAQREAELAGAAKIQTNYEAYARYQQMTPEQLRRVPVSELRRNLGDSELEKVIDRTKPGRATQADELTFTEIARITGSSLTAAGLDTAGVSGRQREAVAGQRNNFFREMTRWAEGEKARSGQYPTTQQMQVQADRYLMTLAVGGDEMFAFEAPTASGNPRARQGSVVVPDDVEARIRRAAPDATDAEVRQIYVQGRGTRW